MCHIMLMILIIEMLMTSEVDININTTNQIHAKMQWGNDLFSNYNQFYYSDNRLTSRKSETNVHPKVTKAWPDQNLNPEPLITNLDPTATQLMRIRLNVSLLFLSCSSDTSKGKIKKRKLIHAMLLYFHRG